MRGVPSNSLARLAPSPRVCGATCRRRGPVLGAASRVCSCPTAAGNCSVVPEAAGEEDTVAGILRRKTARGHHQPTSFFTVPLPHPRRRWLRSFFTAPTAPPTSPVLTSPALESR